MAVQVWSDQAKALTLQAAKAAGLGEGSSDIRLISEPEAAAVHCLRTFQETKHCLKVSNNTLLFMYQLRRLEKLKRLTSHRNLIRLGTFL